MTKKRVAIISTVCILGVIIMSIFVWLGKPSFITQDMDELVRIVIVSEPYHLGENKSYDVTERSEMEILYKLLRETTSVRVYRNPQHSESVQWDSMFSIHFVYRDGEADEFFATEINGNIVRFLNTTGNSGDPGFIIGSNEMLWKYIADMTQNKV